jgi:hypothetical protein
MRVLITNTRLDARAGEESCVQELARELQRLGHAVIAWSSDTRQRPRLLENDVVPVATDLAHLPVQPDIIHAQHHLDAMTALAALPDVPVVYQSHGETWPGAAPIHPRIYRHLGESDTAAGRVGDLVGIYEQVIAEHRATPVDRRADLLATSRYLREIGPAIKATNVALKGRWASASRANTFYDLRARLVLLEAQLAIDAPPASPHGPVR